MKGTKENIETLPLYCMRQTRMSEQKCRMEDLEGSFQIAEKITFKSIEEISYIVSY